MTTVCASSIPPHNGKTGSIGLCLFLKVSGPPLSYSIVYTLTRNLTYTLIFILYILLYCLIYSLIFIPLISSIFLAGLGVVTHPLKKKDPKSASKQGLGLAQRNKGPGLGLGLGNTLPPTVTPHTTVFTQSDPTYVCEVKVEGRSGCITCNGYPGQLQVNPFDQIIPTLHHTHL